jgi:ribosomal protein S18 acetylase RimI-like enzyme
MSRTEADNPDSHITLRPLHAGDQDFLWDVLYEALWDPPGAQRRPRSLLEKPLVAAYVENWGSGTHDLGFVATTATGGRAGAVWSRLLLPPLAGGAFFDEYTPQLGIAVFPAWQRQGIGERLLRHHLAAARGLSPRFSLGVHPENIGAIRLYERCGFRQFASGAGGYLNMVADIIPNL